MPSIKFNLGTTTPFILLGTFIDAPTPYNLRIRTQHYCLLDARGSIHTIAPQGEKSLEELEKEAVDAWGNEPWEGKDKEGRRVEVIGMKSCQVVCVGLVDCHIHAPQYNQLGTKTDLPLMEWLEKYTFPTEASFADEHIARRAYQALICRLLRNGTTTAVYFSSNHLSSTKILAITAATYGQRAYIGKNCSDQNVPEYYVEKMEDSLAGTEEFLKWVQDQWGMEGLIKAVVTPRFVPTCSLELLEGLGALAKKYDVHVQTHAAESVDEVNYVQSLHPNLGGGRDIAILERVGLLTDKTILAHCCHLGDEEVEKLVEYKAGIVSCPHSNILFARQTVPISKWYSPPAPPIPQTSTVSSSISTENLGLTKISLGTDISGGPSASLWHNIRLAILQDRIDSFVPRLTPTTVTTNSSLPKEDWTVDYKYAYHLATYGGARTLNMEDTLGTFDRGKKFDAVMVDFDLAEEEGAFEFDVGVGDWAVGNAGGKKSEYSRDRMEEEEALLREKVQEGFEKFVVCGDDRNIIKVWVNGQEVCSRA